MASGARCIAVSVRGYRDRNHEWSEMENQIRGWLYERCDIKIPAVAMPGKTWLG